MRDLALDHAGAPALTVWGFDLLLDDVYMNGPEVGDAIRHVLLVAHPRWGTAWGTGEMWPRDQWCSGLEVLEREDAVTWPHGLGRTARYRCRRTGVAAQWHRSDVDWAEPPVLSDPPLMIADPAIHAVDTDHDVWHRLLVESVEEYPVEPPGQQVVLSRRTQPGRDAEPRQQPRQGWLRARRLGVRLLGTR